MKKPCPYCCDIGEKREVELYWENHMAEGVKAKYCPMCGRILENPSCVYCTNHFLLYDENLKCSVFCCVRLSVDKPCQFESNKKNHHDIFDKYGGYKKP